MAFILSSIRLTMTTQQLIDKYVSNLEDEFVANNSLWSRSLEIANASFADINQKYNTHFPPISYDAFCFDAREMARQFLNTCDLEKVLVIEEEEVLRFSPGLTKLTGEEFETSYLASARQIHKQRILELQVSLHRYCIKACLEKRAPEEYKRFAIILESIWDLHQQSSMQ